MSLTKNQLAELRGSYSKDIYMAFVSPSVREDTRAEIKKDVDRFIKNGGKIKKLGTTIGAGGVSRVKITDQEQRTMELKIRQLRKECGNTCNIRWDIETCRFKAFFAGREIERGFDCIKKASKAIKDAAVKSGR